jgi:acetoin utilization deacetylase AcuC-like enzyme
MPPRRPRTVVYSPRYECDIGPHVFPTRKYRLVMRRLLDDGLIDASAVREPQPASRAELELVHARDYLDDLMDLRPSPRVLLSELPITAAIRDAAILGAGGTILAARCALEDGAAMHLGGGFHHAMPGHAEGFCYLNDIAIAIRALQREGAIARAAVIDTDVHQGNGTARIFRGDPSVFTFSIHQENNYPVKERSDLDIGLDDGTGDEEYLRLLGGALPRILDGHRPDLVIMPAGADPYREDQLGGLAMTIDGLRRRDELVAAACARRRIPVVGALAGGYARDVQDTVTIHVNTALAVLHAGER